MCGWHKHSHKDPWSRIENTKINPHTYNQTICENAKTIQGRGNSLFKNSVGTVDTHMQKNGVGLLPHTTYKSELKMVHKT